MNNELYTRTEIESHAAIVNATCTRTGENAQILVYELGPCYRAVEYTFVHAGFGKYKLMGKKAK